jgi:hypothetical protein
MKWRRTISTLPALLMLCSFTSVEALAQQMQRVSFKTLAENTKYTQEHTLDVGDVPGHQVRIYEFHRTFPSDPPVINGIKVKESWGRNISDYTDLNGPGTVYTVYVMENGDKFFIRGSLVAQSSWNSDGSRQTTATAVGNITGGTGKLVGMTGMFRTVTIFDPKAGLNEGTVEIEYTFVK